MKKYRQVAKRISSLVESGALSAGEQAPSVRSMAAQMGLSVMTVLAGYRALENEGLLEARPKSGYFVRPAHLRAAHRLIRPPQAHSEAIPIRSRPVRIADEVEAILQAPHRENIVPLGAGIPSPEFLPSEAMSIHMSRVVRSDPLGVNRYCLAPGAEALRVQIARRLIESGCTTSPDEILVTGGATEGTILALRCLARPGDSVAVESPGYFGFYRALEFLNLKAIEIPSDPQTGLSLEAVEKLLGRRRSVRCILLCSNGSNPTGATMPAENKARLTELARQAGVPIIEDETYGELAFADHRSETLKAFDNDNVLQTSGFGKILSPGYRVGYLAAGRFHGEVRRLEGMAYLTCPLPNQLAVASFLKDGGMARHLRRLRRTYQDSVRLFQQAVVNSFPAGTRTSDPSGGHFLWVELPAGGDSVALAAEAMERDISIAPGVVFSAEQHYRRFLRLNCAMPWTDGVANAVAMVGELASRQ